MNVLEVCTVSSSAYALVFPRAHALNQRYAGQMQVDILCGDGAEVALMRAQGMHVVTANLYRSLNPVQLARSAWHLWQVIRHGDYDVVHLHFGIPGLVGRFLALFVHQPVWLYQSHGYSIAENTGILARYAYLLVEKLLKNTVRYSLFQLREDMELAQRYRLLHAEQMVFLGNGIDLTVFKPIMPAQREAVTFGMVARFEPIKNHALLLDAVAILMQQTRQFRVKLIGQGYLQAEIQQRITQLGLTDLIEILPYCHDMPTFYQQIDVGVLTSFAEGIPRALIEPMACGKPVICTDVKGSREAIIDGVTGFKVPLDSPVQLAEKMLWFIDHPEARQRMGQAARQHAEQHFSAERIIHTLGELYLSCLPTATTAEQTA